LPSNGILPSAKFTLRPSLAFSYIGSVTARHLLNIIQQRATPIFGERPSRWASAHILVTFCVSRRRRKMYCGHARLCVCMSVCVSVFSAHVYCGQTAGWMKLVLGMEVGLSPGDFVLDGDPVPFCLCVCLFGFSTVEFVLTTSPSSSICVQVLRSPTLAALLHGIYSTSFNRARGRHLYSESGHHVGHRPTF